MSQPKYHEISCFVNTFPFPDGIDNAGRHARITDVHRRVDDSEEMIDRIRCQTEMPGAYPVLCLGEKICKRKTILRKAGFLLH